MKAVETIRVIGRMILTLIGIERKLEKIMAQLDDLKALIAEVKASQAEEATSLADLANDVDKLLQIISQPGVDLTEAIAAATEVRDQATALAAAAKATSEKFDSTV